MMSDDKDLRSEVWQSVRDRIDEIDPEGKGLIYNSFFGDGKTDKVQKLEQKLNEWEMTLYGLLGGIEEGRIEEAIIANTSRNEEPLPQEDRDRLVKEKIRDFVGEENKEEMATAYCYVAFFEQLDKYMELMVNKKCDRIENNQGGEVIELEVGKEKMDIKQAIINALEGLGLGKRAAEEKLRSFEREINPLIDGEFSNRGLVSIERGGIQ